MRNAQLFIDPGHGLGPTSMSVVKQLLAYRSDPTEIPLERGFKFGRPLMLSKLDRLYREDIGTYRIATALCSELYNHSWFDGDVFMTRSDEMLGPVFHAKKEGKIEAITYSTSFTGFDLQTRVNLVNDWYDHKKKSAFISIHTNAAASPHANGFEVFHSSSSSSRRLAQCVQRSFRASSLFRVRSLKEKRFYLLKYTKMPAVLVECGFHTNTRDLRVIIDRRLFIAEVLASGIMDYFRG